MWAEALLRRAMLKEQMGYDRVLVKKSAIHAHKMIDERGLPDHVKIRADLVTAHLLFKTDFIRQVLRSVFMSRDFLFVNSLRHSFSMNVCRK